MVSLNSGDQVTACLLKIQCLKRKKIYNPSILVSAVLFTLPGAGSIWDGTHPRLRELQISHSKIQLRFQ